jgi:hypothetical protein
MGKKRHPLVVLVVRKPITETMRKPLTIIRRSALSTKRPVLFAIEDCVLGVWWVGSEHSSLRIRVAWNKRRTWESEEC